MMGEIIVVGRFDRKQVNFTRKMINRSSAPLGVGNPFVIGKDGTREEVVEKYRNFIWRECLVKNNWPDIEAKVWIEKRVVEVANGMNLELCCTCRVNAHRFRSCKDDSEIPCHGDVLREVIIYLVENKIKSNKNKSKLVCYN